VWLWDVLGDGMDEEGVWGGVVLLIQDSFLI